MEVRKKMEELLTIKLRLKMSEVIHSCAKNIHHRPLFLKVIEISLYKFKNMTPFLLSFLENIDKLDDLHKLSMFINYIPTMELDFIEYFTTMIQCEYQYIKDILTKETI